jgi:hypothetical protein
MKTSTLLPAAFGSRSRAANFTLSAKCKESQLVREALDDRAARFVGVRVARRE